MRLELRPLAGLLGLVLFTTGSAGFAATGLEEETAETEVTETRYVSNQKLPIAFGLFPSLALVILIK